MPALTLAAFPAGLIARMTRGSMLEALEEDYIRTARAYGLPDRLITFGYALKNAIGPTLSVIGLSFAFALTGSFFVEIIFGWPGLGLFTVRSLLASGLPRDHGDHVPRGRRLHHDQPDRGPGAGLGGPAGDAVMTSMPVAYDGGPAVAARGRSLRHVVDVLRRDKLALAAVIIILLFFLAALLAPWIAPYPLQGAGKPSPSTLTLPPSAQHIMGTDELGRDVFSRLLYGAKPTLIVPFIVVILAVLIGAPLGALAGFRGGWIDRVIMRTTDLFLAFPSLLLAMAITAAIGPGLFHAALALVVSWWPWYTRLVRGEAARLRQRNFVDAARAMGVPSRTIVRGTSCPTPSPRSWCRRRSTSGS